MKFEFVVDTNILLKPAKKRSDKLSWLSALAHNCLKRMQKGVVAISARTTWKYIYTDGLEAVVTIVERTPSKEAIRFVIVRSELVTFTVKCRRIFFIISNFPTANLFVWKVKIVQPNTLIHSVITCIYLEKGFFS